MTQAKLACWGDVFRVCMRATGTELLAKHLVQLPEDDRLMLLDSIDSDLLRAKVDCLLRGQQQQLALV